MAKPIVASYCTTFLKPEMLHIYRQISGLNRYETFVICKQHQSQERFPMPDSSVIKVPTVKSNFLRRFWLKYVKKAPPIVYRGEYGALAKVLDRQRCDVMHIYFGHTGVHLLPFIQQWKKPVVVSFHGMDIQTRAHDPQYELRLRELLQSVSLVLARSESLLDRLRDLGCPEAKLRINRTGIPLHQFPTQMRQCPEDGAWHLVQACRLIEKKGLDDTLHAFAALRDKFPQAKLTIAGEGPLQKELEQLCQELNLSEAVNFAGFLSSEALNQLYQKAHIFIHPSRMTADQNQEGVPNAMLEAMATGMPVVATYHGGIPEAVKNEKSGLLVAERDREGLIQSLLRLTSDGSLWSRMGKQAALDMQENFESRAQIEKLEACYDEAVRLHS